MGAGWRVRALKHYIWCFDAVYGTNAHHMLKILEQTMRPSALVPPAARAQSCELRPATSAIQTAVENFAKALQAELPSGSAVERAAIADYIDIECQRYRLRLIREQIERAYGLSHIWLLLCRAMLEAAGASGVAPADVEDSAKAIVTRWSDGDPAACEELLAYGIDADQAISQGIVSNLASLAQIERERERLASRARLLMVDIERSASFMEQRKIPTIPEAEVILE